MVEVLVDNAGLPEYDDIEDSSSHGNRAAKYIEARFDKNFSIRFAFSKLFPYLTGDAMAVVSLDGDVIDGAIITVDKFFNLKGHIVVGRSA